MDAPADPRAGWRLPDPGAMPRTAQLEPQVTRVLAPNASGMTLDGTNTYLVGEPGRGEVAIVDPGPDDVRHLTAVEEALRARDARCVAVLVTHHHGDHAEAAEPWGTRFGATVAAADRRGTGPPRPLPGGGGKTSVGGGGSGGPPAPGGPPP